MTIKGALGPIRKYGGCTKTPDRISVVAQSIGATHIVIDTNAAYYFRVVVEASKKSRYMTDELVSMFIKAQLLSIVQEEGLAIDRVVFYFDGRTPAVKEETKRARLLQISQRELEKFGKSQRPSRKEQGPSKKTILEETSSASQKDIVFDTLGLF